MSISNYPNGFAQGVAIRGIPLLNMHGGNVFWVDSVSGADTGKGTHNQPFASIDYAVGRCTTDQGDIIIVKAGHTETVATDGGLTIDVSGISIVGLGEGDNRPLVSIGTLVAAAAILSANGCVVENMRFSIAIDAATDPIQITGSGNIMRYCEIIEAAACEAIDLISIGADANRNVLHNLKIRGRNTADGDAHCAIHLNGCDDCEIYNIHAYNGDWQEAVIFNEVDECLNVHIHDCILQTQAVEDLCIVLDSAATGEIHDLKCILKDDAANIDECLSIGDCHAFDPILVVNADSEKGIEWAGTDSADA